MHEAAGASGPALALGGQACQRRPRPDGVL